LHAVTYIAGQKQDHPIASHVVAQAQGLPERFLLKVLKPLVSARMLRSIKGPNGGYQLARPAKEISLLDIVEAVDGPIRGQVPVFDSNGGGKLDRKLEVICNEAADLVRGQFQKVRIANLVGKK
jgi:Rrf2 family protein